VGRVAQFVVFQSANARGILFGFKRSAAIFRAASSPVKCAAKRNATEINNRPKERALGET